MPEIQMPKLSDTMTEGTLVSWKKKVGEQVKAGEVLAEIETDKATMEWESTEDGLLKKIYVEEGGKVNVGDRIAFIGEEGEEAPENGAAKQEEPKGETESPRARRSERRGESRRNKKLPATKPRPTRRRKPRPAESRPLRSRAKLPPRKAST